MRRLKVWNGASAAASREQIHTLRGMLRKGGGSDDAAVIDARILRRMDSANPHEASQVMCWEVRCTVSFHCSWDGVYSGSYG